MQKLLLFVTVFLVKSLFSQESTDITTTVNQLLNEQKAPGTKIILSLNESSFELLNVNRAVGKNRQSISAQLSGGEGELIFKNFNGRISGFIYLPGELYGFKIEEKGGKIMAVKVSKKEIILESAPEKKELRHPGHGSRNLPLGNSLVASGFNLESKPGSANVLYLDFNGENITGMGYNFWDMKNTGATDDEMRLIWEVVAADFAAFDINVTTKRALYDACLLTNKIMCVFGNNSIGGAAGLSFVNIFGTAKASIVSTSASGLGVDCGHIATHELGHAFGMYHDGTSWPGPVAEYYSGNSDWAPNMGSCWGKNYVTWSKGEYAYASQKQDDINIIATQTGFRADDLTLASALIIGAGDSLNWQDNYGIIETVNDVDTFYFETTATGNVNISVGTAVKHTNLDVEITLLNSSLTALANNNTDHERYARISQNLPAGKYYLLVKGGFESAYFTNYSSFGYYEVSGTVDNFKRGDVDVVLFAINGLGNLCGNNSTATIEVKNAGSKTVSGGVLNVYLDAVLDTSVNITSIASLGVYQLTGLAFSATGSHTVKAEYVPALGVTESTLKNNTLEKSYFFNKGHEMRFTTSLPQYSKSSTLTWEIKDSKGVIVKNSTQYEVENSAGLKSQAFCLEEGCYDFVLSGNYNLCDVNYTPYTPGATYVWKDVVSLAGKVYSAKWWTQTAPPSGAWQLVGECNNAAYTTQLNDITSGTTLSSSTSADLTGSITDAFCLNLISSVEEKIKSTVLVYPNPVNDNFSLNSPSLIQRISLSDINGKEVMNSPINALNASIDCSVLSSGVYVLSVYFENEVQVVKIVK